MTDAPHSAADDDGPLRLGVVGAAGRLGSSIVELAAATDGFEVRAALGRSGTTAGRPLHELVPGLARSSPPLSVSERLDVPVDVLVDASTPEGAVSWAREAAARGIPFVSGTTGLTPEQESELGRAAQEIPLLQAANLSLGATVLLRLVAEATARLGNGFEVAVREHHHAAKRDAPSGTALALARAIETAGGTVGAVHSLRSGRRVGDHQVLFEAAEESVSLSHSAHDRRVFARGALAAARFLLRRPAGRYTMNDVTDALGEA